MQNQVRKCISQAIKSVNGVSIPIGEIPLEPATLTELADIQSSIAFKLTKKFKDKPIDIANQIVGAFEQHDVFSSVSVSGPGFLNFRLSNHYLVSAMKSVEEYIEKCTNQTATVKPLLIVDYSGPNAAKQMHVGHLRSTIIGDSIANVYEFLGWEVRRINHIGDWGTQFGMIIQELVEREQSHQEKFSLDEIEDIYRQARKKFEDDHDFRQRSLDRVIMLQNGNPETLLLWRSIRNASILEFQGLYNILNVKLNLKCIVGESSYKDELSNVMNELVDLNLAKHEHSTQVCIAEVPLNKRDNPYPYMIRKADGGFLYSTTDLAALRHRIKKMKAERIIYVTDNRQADHFECLFHLSYSSNWSNNSPVTLLHIPFGTVLGDNGLPLKTRESRNVLLIDLIKEGTQRSLGILKSRNPDLPENELKELAAKLAIATIKYSDLSMERQKNYIFSWEKFLSFQGDTAVYIIFASTRAKSLLRKTNVSGLANLILPEVLAKVERDLILEIIRMPTVINLAIEKHRLNLICAYLYGLAKAYHRFYETAPIFKNCSIKEREFRLRLTYQFALIVDIIFSLLGIESFEQI
ncbi:arginyl-tRNA synthetase [Bathymodiolus platifrons methanotrophic gill symbiont]|uniref:arginine--tRNA ligase n=1 Tax=Bathymodiolus platifrons methanotrophic gill symbiont TaxID=113268 RepID=UPI000B41E107|nr:arginine--tRNA ligase [Bathymodiolus platifrons methanotrophic gill symbiont]GAW87413.1 arginyl-tRNA synthetase [Bathymodiolus platifrons methanotrophic gill symbiont]GFO74247.1 arginyl-tRNA synthetase [Bathymodiolus platifrons methanotrophic gill symbiont]